MHPEEFGRSTPTEAWAADGQDELGTFRENGPAAICDQKHQGK